MANDCRSIAFSGAAVLIALAAFPLVAGLVADGIEPWMVTGSLVCGGSAISMILRGIGRDRAGVVCLTGFLSAAMVWNIARLSTRLVGGPFHVSTSDVLGLTFYGAMLLATLITGRRVYRSTDPTVLV